MSILMPLPRCLDYCNLVVSFEIGKCEGVVALGENYLGLTRLWNKILPGVMCGELGLSIPKWKLISGESTVWKMQHGGNKLSRGLLC